MSRTCSECGQVIEKPRMNETEYRKMLEEICGVLGRENRIVKWLEDVEKEHGLTEAIFTLEDYMKGG